MWKFTNKYAPNKHTVKWVNFSVTNVYRVFSKKHPGTYLKFLFKGAALTEGEHLIELGAYFVISPNN